MNSKALLLWYFALLSHACLWAPIKFSNQDCALKFNHPDSRLILDAPLTGVDGTIALKDNATTRISGNSVSFAQGKLEVGDFSSVLTCTFNTGGNDTILLNGNSLLDARYGNVLSPIVVSGNNNLLAGSPIFAVPTVLSDAATELSLNLKSKLNKNLILNGGTIHLLGDLEFDQDVQLVGDGIIQANGKTVRNCNGTWAGNLTFSGGVTIELNAEMLKLSNANWTFIGAGKVSSIEGDGNIFELSNTANLIVGPGHTLVLANLFCKGLDDYEGNGLVIDSSGVIKVTRSSLGLQSPYTLNQGQLVVFGDISKIVSAGYDFTINGSAQLVVDGTTLWYDTLDQINQSPVKFTNELTQRLYLNGGIIKSSKGEDGINGLDGSNPLSDKVITTMFASLTNNFDITESSRIIAQNPTAGVRHVELDGKGYTLRMPSGSNKYFIIEPYITLTLKNVFLRGFNPDTIDWGLGSQLIFGDGTVIELPRPVNIDRSYLVHGNVIIDGRGTNLTLLHDDALLINPMANLNIRNATVFGAAEGPHGRLRIMDESATPGIITLQDSGLALDSDYTFSRGSLLVSSDAKIYGRDKTFTFNSTGTIFIAANSTLTIDYSITFSYAPAIPSWGLQHYKFSKERLVFMDPSSTLHLNGCTLHSTHTGLRLKDGRVLVQDNVKMRSVAGIDEGIYGHAVPSSGEELEIYSSADVRVLAASTLDLYGKINYVVE